MNTEYKIEKLRDLFNVPEDKIDECIDEIRDYIKSVKPFYDSAKMIADSLGQKVEQMIDIRGVTWIDDGKNERTLEVEIVAKIEGEK